MPALIITHTDCLRHKTGAKTKTDSALGLLGSKILGTLITPLIEKSWTSRDSDLPSDIAL